MGKGSVQMSNRDFWLDERIAVVPDVLISSAHPMKSKHNTAHAGQSALAERIRNHKSAFEVAAYNACTPKDISKCTLARGIENLFVAGIMQRIFQRFLKKQHAWTYEECFYMPSTYIEGKCGFDVSIGYYEQRLRVRLMHKLIQRWCDTDWTWNLTKRERRHIYLIVRQCLATKKKNGGCIRPFASFSICYCLHEFRRMGNEGVPKFEDKARHLFIDLEPLCGSRINNENFGLTIQRKDGEYKAICTASGKQIKLSPLSWDEFLDNAIDPIAA